jgi:hypothetical protein
METFPTLRVFAEIADAKRETIKAVLTERLLAERLDAVRNPVERRVVLRTGGTAKGTPVRRAPLPMKRPKIAAEESDEIKAVLTDNPYTDTLDAVTTPVLTRKKLASELFRMPVKNLKLLRMATKVILNIKNNNT